MNLIHLCILFALVFTHSMILGGDESPSIGRDISKERESGEKKGDAQHPIEKMKEKAPFVQFG